MLGKRRWLSLTLVVSLATAGLGVSASADTTTEAEFVALINASRSANGLAPLAVDGKLRSYARTHTQRMIEAGKIYHSSGDQLASAGTDGWTKLGENVGAGGVPSGLHQAFMGSPSHRANILGSDYNYVGVGTDYDANNNMYVTVIFMALSNSTTTTTAPPATTTTTNPGSPPTTTGDPTTTTTTMPATTTTTTTLLEVGPDQPVTPGESCSTASRHGWMCHD